MSICRGGAGSPSQRRRWRPPLGALALLLGAAAAFGAAAPDEAVRHLEARHRQWLELVAPLLSDAERQAFLALDKEYQRDAFIRRFWQVRDPHPETAGNEFEESWEERAELARQRYGDLQGDDRSRMLLFNGEPQSVVQATCLDVLRPLEIWFYPRTDRIRDSFALVFVAAGGASRGPFRLWYPSQGPWPLLEPRGGEPPTMDQAVELIGDDCPRSREILAGLSSALDWGWVEANVQLVPNPGDEWLRTFLSFSTDLPAAAATFAADFELSFPGRHQSRTQVQGLLSVPAPEGGAAGPRSFVLDGEVLRKEELFEHFRYRFNLLPEEAVDGRLPLVFERSLRPGDYTLVVKLEDLDRHAFFRQERPLAVPELTAPAVAAAATAAAPPGTPVRRLAEANSALGTGDVVVQLAAPPARLLTGHARFEAFATGPGVAKVRFDLDGKTVLAKTRPPYSVELNLGEAPREHRLRATALDADGEELASDEVEVNAGPHRFAVRLLEPRAGEFYVESLRASAAVEVPEGETLDRVELYLNEDLVATLYQPPFTQPILLPQGRETNFVRAVAFLSDGNSTEDAVFINAPDYSADLKVNFVELYTTVTDRRGRPVEGLGAADFTVREDGVVQQVRRFERVRDLPIYAGILLDTSSSMLEELDDAVKGAQAFFRDVLTPKDRAAVITFNEAPHLVVRFTNDREVLAGGLAGLTAEGETALYDSLIYGLYYFSGVKGKRALILLSDGEDVGSRYSFDEVVEYARRTGVAIYAVGIKLGSRQADVRLKLGRLASETGGLAFFIDTASGLDRVYETVEAELRSQYLLAYQSSSEGGDERFREVEVKVSTPGVEAKTIRGYYP
jgi:VWFA-related protein